MLTPIQVNILQDYLDLINYLELQGKYVFAYSISLWKCARIMQTSFTYEKQGTVNRTLYPLL